MASDLDLFIDVLKSSRLMTADQVAAFLDKLSAAERPTDSKHFVETLIEKRKLTRYQADRLIEGKSHGLVFGNYHVLDKLGEGGMGIVYLARHQRMHRMVALKVLSADAIQSPEAVQRFHREVAAVARLVHPNIVTAYDADEENGMHFLVMEFVDGQNLAQIVKSKGPLPLAVALSCVWQAAKGLEYAHSEGVIHRDIKPHNLLLDKRGNIKILDLGLARFQRGVMGADKGDTEEGIGVGTLSQTGTVMGTVHFMAPEQAEDIKRTDHRADIYSLGCTFYYAITGQFIYPKDTVVKVILAHRESEIPLLRTGCPEVTDSIEHIYRRMVAKRPQERYQSMSEVVNDFETCGVTFRTDMGASVFRVDSFMATTDSGSQVSKSAGASTPSTPLPVSADGVAASGAKKLEETSDVSAPAAIAMTGATRIATSPPFTPVEKAPSGVRSASTGTRTLEKAPSDKSTQKGDAELPRFLQKAMDQERQATSPTSDAAASSDSNVDSELKSLRGQVSDWKIQIRQRRSRIVVAGTLFVFVAALVLIVFPPSQLVLITSLAPSVNLPYNSKTARELQEYFAAAEKVDLAVTNGIGMKFVLIPPAEFKIPATQMDYKQLGAPTEVNIERPFYIGATEVTLGQFRQFIKATGHVTAAEKTGSGLAIIGQQMRSSNGLNYQKSTYPLTDEHPVVHVSWRDADAFCKWLTETEKQEYRLPTEQEWEHACRAGSLFPWSSGQQPVTALEYGWLIENFANKFEARPVGLKLPNAFGVHDMHGNVWEWCRAPSTAPSPYVIRGGAFWSYTQDARAAARFEKDSEDFSTGFRVIRSIPNRDEEAPKISAADGTANAQ